MIAGMDTHKDTLAVAVIDDAGRVITRRQVPNDDGGYVRLSGLLAGMTCAGWVSKGLGFTVGRPPRHWPRQAVSRWSRCPRC